MSKKDKNEKKDKSIFGIRPYKRILIARKVMGLWVEFPMIDRMNNDPDEFFRQTQDHYSRKWGAKNVRLRLYWEDEIYNGQGKQLK